MNNQLEQSIHQLRVQKQRMQHERIELESALEELEDTSDSWKVIGNLMVKKDPASIKDELSKELESVQARIGSLEQQEKRLQEKAQEHQQASGSARND